jgi:putative oxidoreductase
MATSDGSLKRDLGLLILRLGTAGLLFAGHGWSKITHFNERAGHFSDPLHVGSTISLTLVVFAEVFCSALVAVGLLTRWTIIPIIIFMLVAGFLQHGHDPWSKKELAFLYLIPSVTLFLTGPGRFSIDGLMAKGRKSRP